MNATVRLPYSGERVSQYSAAEVAAISPLDVIHKEAVEILNAKAAAKDQPKTAKPKTSGKAKQPKAKAAKAAKNFAEADRIRKELLAQGIALKDSPAGTTWEAAQ